MASKSDGASGVRHVNPLHLGSNDSPDASEDEDAQPPLSRASTVGVPAGRDPSMFESTDFANAAARDADNVHASEATLDLDEAQERELAWGSLQSHRAFIDGEIDEAIVNWCRNACASVWLDTMVMASIILSTAALCWEHPANTLGSRTQNFLLVLDMILTVLFTVEMIIRVIAMGWWDRTGTVKVRETTYENVVFEPRYMNDNWNKLDCFVVVTSIFNAVVTVFDWQLPFSIGMLRALRILRVLKAFRKVEGIRQILGTIWQAMPYSANIVAFMGFLFLVLAIIGVQLFRGAGLKKCVLSGVDLQSQLDPDKFPLPQLAPFSPGDSHSWPQPPPVLAPSYEYPLGTGMWVTYCTEDNDCPLYDIPGVWNRTQTCQPSLNPGKGFQSFDSIASAWLSLFINMAMLYWWETGHRIADANIPFSSSVAWLYGFINVFVLTYVTANMFVAVITTVFMDVRTQRNPEGGLGGTHESVEEKLARQQEEYRKRAAAWKPPCYFVSAFGGSGPYIDLDQNEQRSGIIWHKNFDRIILAFILMNTVTLALDYHDAEECDDPTTPEIEMQPAGGSLCQSEEFIDTMQYTNYVFNAVFTVECVMKICGLGFKEYISNMFNSLDFFIVVTSVADMFGEIMYSDNSENLSIFKLFRILRLFRVLRVARILYKNENLKRVLTTVFGSGKAIANLIVFILFAVLLFAILGMHLTGGMYTPVNNPSLQYGDNSETLWGRLAGSGHFEQFEDVGNSSRYGYDVQEFIRKGLIPRRNFEDFPRSLLLSFQIITGDDWVNQMHDVMEVCGGILSPLIFISNFAFCNFILLSLFIAVILENFEVAEAEKAELQKLKFEKDQINRLNAAQKPKISFVHRFVWFCGGEGGVGRFQFGMLPSQQLDTEGRYGPRRIDKDGDETPVEFGTLLPGNKWYNDDNALFVLPPDAPLREKMRAIAKSSYMDTIVLFAIALSTLVLIWEGPPHSIEAQGDSAIFGKDTQNILDLINHILFSIFVVEFVVKICANGFAFTPEAYIKDPWNKLDFIVIAGSSMAYVGVNANIVKLLRCLRPLRVINRNEGMRVIIIAVLDSLAVNIGVLCLAVVGLLVFAILAVNLFAGQFYSCSCTFVYPAGITPSRMDIQFAPDGGYTILSQNHTVSGVAAGEKAPTCDACGNSDNCEKVCMVTKQQHCIGINGTGGIFGSDPNYPDAISQCYWDNRPYHFDNVPSAMMALFSASTLAGWTDIMEAAIDSTGIGYQPIPFSGRWEFVVVYFILYIIIMSFFLTNLFVGVLIDFIGNSDGSALLTEKQKAAQDIQKFTKMHRPIKRDVAPVNSVRCWLYHLVESDFWKIMSSSFIVFNVCVMMCEYEGQSEAWWSTLNFLNNVICLGFFTFEMAVKLVAYFPRKYIADNWSKFDAMVIVLSWIALYTDLSGAGAIRALRAMRIVLVVKSAKGMRALFQTLALSITPARNISFLLLLLYSLYALIGMMMFGNTPIQDVDCTQETGISTMPEWCDLSKGRQLEYDPSSWSDLAKGKPGQVLAGLNRQYTRHSSFRSFSSSLALLIQCSAGQDWKFVMYAVGGEPGLPGNSSAATFAFFMSFLFFSNYILLNLFIVVILDTFGGLLRESALNISERDFERFKFTFRDFTSDAEPEKLQFRALWPLLSRMGSETGYDDDGYPIETPLAPPALVSWGSDDRFTWTRARTKFGEEKKPVCSDFESFLRIYYEEEQSFLQRPTERVGLTFHEYVDELMQTPAWFESADINTSGPWDSNGPGSIAPEAAEWETFRLFYTADARRTERQRALDLIQLLSANAEKVWNTFDVDGDGALNIEELKLGLAKIGEQVSYDELDAFMGLADNDGDGTLTRAEFIQTADSMRNISPRSDVDGGSSEATLNYTTLEWAIRTLRFRMRYVKLLAELKFHGHLYIDHNSTLSYSDLLQALVNLNLGEGALTIEQRMLRELSQQEITAGSSKFRDAHWARILAEHREDIERQIESAKVTPGFKDRELKSLLADLESVKAAQNELAQAEDEVVEDGDTMICQGAVLCQYRGQRAFKSAWLELSGSQLQWRRMKGGPVTRTADVANIVLSNPRNPRKGHPHALRLNLATNDDKGDHKHVISPQNEQDRQMWIDALVNCCDGLWDSGATTGDEGGHDAKLTVLAGE